MLLEQIGDRQQRLLPLPGHGVAPTLECGGSRRVGTVDVLRTRRGCRGEDLTGGRIDQIDGLALGSRDGCAVDDVSDFAGGHGDLLLPATVGPVDSLIFRRRYRESMDFVEKRRKIRRNQSLNDHLAADSLAFPDR